MSEQRRRIDDVLRVFLQAFGSWKDEVTTTILASPPPDDVFFRSSRRRLVNKNGPTSINRLINQSISQ